MNYEPIEVRPTDPEVRVAGRVVESYGGSADAHAHTFPKERDGYFMIESIPRSHRSHHHVHRRADEADPLPLEEQDGQDRQGDRRLGPPRGAEQDHYFALLADNADYYEIRYDSREMTWQLTRVWMEG